MAAAAAAASQQQLLRVLCRLCLQESNELDDIFGAGGDSCSTLHMRIMSSVSLEIHRSDNLPKGICPACRYQLEKTYIFRSRCRNNDTRLRRHVKLLAAGKVSRMLEEQDEDDDDEFQPSLDYIKLVDDREKEQEKTRWHEKVATLEEEFRAVAELQRKTIYNEVRNELLSQKYDKVEVGTMTDGGEVVQIVPIEMDELPAEESQPEPLNIKITDCYSVAESSANNSKMKLRDKIHTRLAKQDEELIQYLEEERLMSENDESMEVLDEAVTGSLTADQFIITEVSDSETYVVDTEDRLNDQDLYNSESDSDEDLEAVTNAVKAELAERPNLAVDENCVMKVEKTRDLTKVEVRATDGSLICMEFSRERSTPSPTQSDNTYHVKLGGHEYVCPNCPLTFKNARSLGIHACLAKDAKRFTCDVCQKIHPTKQALTRHYRIHTGEKPFSCTLCDRAFVQKEVLKRHMLTHSDHRPHGCDYCQRRFNQKDQLRHHINRCHSDNPVLTLHKCHICHKTFKHMSGLSRHTATHFGRTYPCATCSKVFNDKSALKRHEFALHGQGTGWKKGASGVAATVAVPTATTSTTATTATANK